MAVSSALSASTCTLNLGFLGSSNLTFAGLSKQGELNVDVTDHDACEKLARWFNDRWGDKWCLDISNEIADIIDQSWARPEPIPPHQALGSSCGIFVCDNDSAQENPPAEGVRSDLTVARKEG
jgi:hypothetical protein